MNTEPKGGIRTAWDNISEEQGAAYHEKACAVPNEKRTVFHEKRIVPNEKRTVFHEKHIASHEKKIMFFMDKAYYAE